MAIGGFGFQTLGASGAGSVTGSGVSRGITDATGGATAAEAALATAQDKVFADVLQKAYDEGDKGKLKEVCTQFESIMLSMMYKGMKATVPESSLFEESNAQEIFDDMLDEELMKRASGRGIGLADMLYRELSKQMDRTYLPSQAGADAQTVPVVESASPPTAGEPETAKTSVDDASAVPAQHTGEPGGQG